MVWSKTKNITAHLIIPVHVVQLNNVMKFNLMKVAMNNNYLEKM